MLKILNSFIENKRIFLLLTLNFLLVIFVILEVSIIKQNKVAFDLWEEKRLHSERAGRILRAERADAAQKLKEEQRLKEEQQDTEK
tara:strand:- start:310 stop:567 length:258 start_codon:yes stop_codon:yes gene_type:complete